MLDISMFIGMTCILQFLAANSILVLPSSSVLNLVLSILALGKMSIRFLEKRANKNQEIMAVISWLIVLFTKSSR